LEHQLWHLRLLSQMSRSILLFDLRQRIWTISERTLGQKVHLKVYHYLTHGMRSNDPVLISRSSSRITFHIRSASQSTSREYPIGLLIFGRTCRMK
jgi:hypothetical protein